MNRIFIVGNITSDIYFDRFLMKGEKRSFLHLLLPSNIDRERGESIRKQYNLPSPNGTSNDVLIVGEVLEGIQLEWLRRSLEKGGGKFSFLRLRLKSDEYLNGPRQEQGQEPRRKRATRG